MRHKPMPDLHYLKSILDYNPDTGLFYYKIKTSNNVKLDKVAGCVDKELNYLKISVNNFRYYAHRLAYFYMTGIDPKEKDVDHKDNNGLNNKFDNLRLATRAQNNGNSRKIKKKSSKYKGVSYHKASQKWSAAIMVNYKRIHLCLYEKEEEAAQAYAQAAFKYFGSFMKL